MDRSHRLQTKPRPAIILAFLMMLALAFVQCFRTTHDLHWAADADFDRDISYVQGTLDGHYGMDPSYTGEYLWYNPLLFSIETALVKVTGLPVNVVVTQAGTWLNILGPIAFFLMAALLMGWEIALAATLSFLFLAAGNIFGYSAATYSPWLYPVCFAQWMFYLDILFCYKAFSTGSRSWFFIVGGFTGLLFLGHAAPAVIIVLIIALLQVGNLFSSINKKDPAATRRYLGQGALALLAFFITSLPLTWFVVGKYHLHTINHEAAEFMEGMFIPANFASLIKANLSVALLVAVIGFISFWKNSRKTLAGKIILAWVAAAAFLFGYSTLVGLVDWKFHIHLPAIVPSFHFFFYLKAAQSLFFGFGFVWLLQLALRRFAPALTPAKTAIALAAATLIIAVAYYPVYSKREDFTFLRNAALYKEDQKDKVATYHFILRNIPPEKVILCPADSSSLFPVMATGRKMVSTAYTFSNPYVDFISRETDRNAMVQYLSTGQPASAKAAFQRYHVDYALLPNEMLADSSATGKIPVKPIYKNNTFTLYSLDLGIPASADNVTLPRSRDKSKL